MNSDEKVQRFSFKPLDSNILEEKSFKEVLYRWNLTGTLNIFKFRYDYEFLTYNTNAFIEDLLGSIEILNPPNQKSNNCSTEFKQQKATLLNTNFFDRLIETDLVSSNGEIAQIIPKYRDNLEISSRLLQMLAKFELEEDDIKYEFSDIEDELMFDIFKILMIGGRYNQRDYDVDTYRECVKKIYKQLVE